MRYLNLTLLLAAFLSSTGCSILGGVEPLSADVKSVSIIERTEEGARVEVVVEVRNPNATPLPMPSCDCTVTVDGIGTFSFSDMPNRTALGKRVDITQDQGVQTFSFFAAFPTGGREIASLPYHVSGNVNYNPPGEIRKLMTDAWIPLPWASFASSGKLQ